MSVPVPDRNESSAQFINDTFLLNQKIGVAYARMSTKYRSTKSVVKMYHIYFRKEIMYEKENNKLRKQLLASAQRQEEILKKISVER